MEKNFKKCLVIGGMAVLFWLLSLCVNSLVRERSEMSDKTQTEISETWSSAQNIVGPIICVPVCKDSVSGSVYTCMYILPERIDLAADVESEILHRGMFDASVYRTKINGSGVFNLKEMAETAKMISSTKTAYYDWNNAQIITAIGDKRGIEEGIKVKIGGKNEELNQHFYNYGNNSVKSVFGGQYEVIGKVVDLSSIVGKSDVAFEISTEVKGSSELNISPIGQSSVLTMRGNCKDPSFNGIMLPSSRNVTDDGFEATWKISSLNRNDVDQVFYSDGEHKSFQTIGTKLLIKGGQYTQTDRALKYAFLVILLSLAAVLVAEMCVKSEINILNYFLIGAALVLFYLMLLSFGEWCGFTVAYFLSAILIIGMITFYLKAIVKKNVVAMAVCSFMALVDGFIYVLLSIASMALLVGTIGLFVMLGIAMFFSLRMSKEKLSL